MEVVHDAMNLDVKIVHKVNLINVKHMEVVQDALNLDARRVHEVNQISALNQEAVQDVLNLDAKRAHKVKLINVLNMEAVQGVLIALTGLIQEADKQNMTIIVPHVLNDSFQMIHVQSEYMNIRKKS
jgi:hypothetical protein